MKTPSNLNYDNTPSVKESSKFLIKALLRKFYIRPKKRVWNFAYKVYTNIYRLPIDDVIVNKDGIKGLFLVASYTNRDRDYLHGLIDSSKAFEKIILYHDKNKKHNFKYNESLRFQLLVMAAKRRGARWVLIGSPKTRFSDTFRKQIEPQINKYANKPVVLGLKERYLWENFDQYAYPKNVIGDAIIYKFFTITDNMIFDNLPIHAAQHPINYTKKINTTASRYYLGRFNIKTMKEKAAFYTQKDGKDYSYLYDIAEPIKHNEIVTGIGKFEKEELLKKS